MAMIQEKERKQLDVIMSVLKNEVKIINFSQEFECNICKMTRELFEEVAGLSDKISIEVRDFVKDADIVKQYNIDKIPATVLLGDRDYGIRFYGVPAGYEFTTLIEDILLISSRNSGLSADVTAELGKVDKPVHIQVMIYPTCPYCALAVRMAHRFAFANDNIVSDMVELTEFPHLALKYHVHGVPKVVINEKIFIDGLPPEDDFVRAVLRSVGK